MLKTGQIIENKDGEEVKVLGVCGEAVLVSYANSPEAGGLFYTEQGLIDDGYTLPKEEWEPIEGITYWFIDNRGRIDTEIWDSDIIYNQEVKSFLGVYKSEADAKKALEEIKAKLGK
jgi:hypothetical protein